MTDALEGLTGDERIVQEAQDRFKRCDDWESTARQRYLLDIKFCEGDSENNYQWDQTIINRRLSDPSGAKPSLTVNETRQHCLQIVNDARQNKAAIEIRAVGEGATYEAAKVFEGIVRHIEYISNAPEIYDSATWHQVAGGIGYWRVTTDYIDDKSFDQEIYLRRVPDPLSVYLDPDIQEYDGSDARFGFVFRDEPRDKWEKEYPRDKEPGDMPFDNSPGSWDTKDHVRVVEYYRKSDKREKVLALDPDFYGFLAEKGYVQPLAAGMSPVVRESDLPDGLAKTFPVGVVLKERETTRVEVEWFKIAGNKIIDRNIWAGTYIPIVRVVGEETIIDGQLDRKGHTRSMKDPQRMLNFWVSAAAEFVALQSKTPYLTPLRAVSGLETFWNNANRENFAYLPYNDTDETGEKIEAPHRQDPPVMAQAFIQGIQLAKTDLMAASGQFQAQMGQNENAKSGIAIQERQRQGDNATYHYIDHLAQAIRFTGRILIDLIPKIYDTPRVVKIMAEDGNQSEVHVDPQAPKPQMMLVGNQPANDEQVKQAQASPDTADEVKAIFNPNVGKYDVVADVGPGYATRRQEQFNAMSQMMAQNPELMKVAGDILFRAADFPMADELAERFKRMVPAQILGEGPPPELEAATEQFKQQMAGMSKVLQQLISENAEKDMKLKNREEENNTRMFDSWTKRFAEIAKVDPDTLKTVFRENVSEALGAPIIPAIAAHAHAEREMMPQEPETVQ